MRKQVWFSALAAGVLLFSACKSEDIPAQGGNDAGITETQEEGLALMLSLSEGQLEMSRAFSNSRAGYTDWSKPGDPGAINASGRPLFSSQKGQDIQRITLYFVYTDTNNDSKQKIALKKEIDREQWYTSSVSTQTGKEGRQLLVYLKKDEAESILSNVTYTVYAVGYSEDKRGTNSLGYTFTPAVGTTISSGTEFTDFNAVIASTLTDSEEVFAGQVKVKLNTNGDALIPSTSEDNGVKNVPVLSLFRQVAGISGYFTNIPAKVGDYVPTHIRLVARKKNNQVNFDMLDTNVGEIGSESQNQVNYVVNGSRTSTSAPAADAIFGEDGGDGYIVYEIDLSKWFKFGAEVSGRATFDKCDLNGDGFVGYADVKKFLTDNSGSKYTDFWSNPNAFVNGHQQGLVQGSVWAGKFVIPFTHDNTNVTLQAQLVTKNSGTVHILRSWDVAIPEADVNKSTGEEVSTGTVVNSFKDKSTKIYNIYRNHMYSIGEKNFDNGNDEGTTDPTDPTVDPDDPDVDPTVPPTDPDDPDDNDKPSDLSKGKELLLHVNSKWEKNHNMELD